VLLVFGVSGIAISMFILAWGFHSATYTLTEDTIQALPESIEVSRLEPVKGITYYSDVSFKAAIEASLGADQAKLYESNLITAAINMNATLVLMGIIGFVASFAISIGPVMWVLFSEIFPNRVRGVAISFVGFINSGVSFLVQLVFPWELSVIGSSATFLLYGVFAVIGLVFILALLPETKNKSLEELETILVKEK
jgi:hypothetical protein